jgi:hypothetical protein
MAIVHSTRVTTKQHSDSAARAQHDRQAKAYLQAQARTMALQHKGVARSRMRPPEADRRTLPPVRLTDLKSLRVSPESPLRPTPAQTILASVQAAGLSLVAVRRLAVKITRELARDHKGGVGAKTGARRGSAFRPESQGDTDFDWDGESGPGSDSSRDGESSGELEYVAYQLALTAAEGDAASLAAILSPVDSAAQTPQQLAEFVRDILAKSDGDVFDLFVKDVLRDTGATSQEQEDFADAIRLWNTRKGSDDELMALFSGALKLPSFKGPDGKKTQERLQERLGERIRETQAEASGKGQRAEKALATVVEFNISPEAADAADPKAFKRMYVEVVKEERSFAAMLKLLARNFLSTLKATIGHLLKALAADMEAIAPSRHKEDLLHLWATATSISQLTMGLTLEGQLQKLNSLMQTLPQQQQRPLDIAKALTGLLDIIEALDTPTSHKFEQLAKDLGVAKGAPTNVFLNGILGIVRLLPEKAFKDKGRTAIQNAAQEAASKAADDEMDELENEALSSGNGGRS